MKNDTLKYLLLSDIHLGHVKNSTKDILSALLRFFTKYKDEIIKTDIIFISGDIFDRLLPSNSKEMVSIMNWMASLLLFCKKSGIKLRVLEGTPGHDFKQMRLFDTIVKGLDIEDEDYRYFDILDIEFMDDLGVSILYLPDEWSESSEETFRLVKEKLKEHALEKVDIIIMHGVFKYQIPQYESDTFHLEENYLNIVNYTINNGHVHFHSQYEKILVPGSFDRLTHSDDDLKKGGLLVTLERENKFTYKFLENLNAMIFKTIDITNLDMAKLDKELKKLSDLNKTVHVRLLTKDSDDKIIFTFNAFKEKYPNLHFTSITKTKKDKTGKEKPILESKRDIRVLKLDENRIRSLIDEMLDEREGITLEQRAIIKEELEELLR